jgi:hypothetical protein
MKFLSISLSLIMIANSTLAQASDLCAKDPDLQRMVTTTKSALFSSNYFLSLTPTQLASYVRTNDFGQAIAHDSVLPNVYTEDLPYNATAYLKTERRFLAVLTDYSHETSQTYAQFVQTAGYMTAQAETVRALDSVATADLPQYFEQILQKLGCAQALAPSLADAADCANINFDGQETNQLHFSNTSDSKALSISNVIASRVNTVLTTSNSCETKRAQINAIFNEPMQTADLDDFLILNWMSHHQNQIAHESPVRRLLAGVSQLNKPIHGPDYRWSEGDAIQAPGDLYFQESAVGMKLFLLGVTLDALSKAQVNYDDFAKLSLSSQNQIITQVEAGLSRGLSDASYRNETTNRARNSCDQKISLLLGGAGAIAQASGLDLGHERFHNFKTMHMYPGEIAKAHGPLYAPRGYTAAGPGSTPGIGSYILHYPALGRYRNVTLNFNHLADADQNLMKYRSCPNQSSCTSDEENAAHSVRVGSTGGDGGAADGPYDHSHINLIAADGFTKLNFVDAFCK